MKGPVEAKVYAALAGGGIGGALGSFLLWLLGVSVWHVSSSAPQSAAANAAVPPPVADLLLILLPGGLAWLAGYLAPHTPRPDLTTPPVPLGPPTLPVTPTPLADTWTAPIVSGTSAGGTLTGVSLDPTPVTTRTQ